MLSVDNFMIIYKLSTTGKFFVLLFAFDSGKVAIEHPSSKCGGSPFHV